MATGVRVVIPKCKLIPSIITVAFIVLGKNLNIRVKVRVDPNADGLTDKWTNKRMENLIHILHHAKSKLKKI